ncbi:MAG: hypothetical protein JXA03_00235, partial [Bacteroidales bacterium]|nr:hypothetical protein [Bacteroidales bacterium]
VATSFRAFPFTVAIPFAMESIRLPLNFLYSNCSKNFPFKRAEFVLSYNLFIASPKVVFLPFLSVAKRTFGLGLFISVSFQFFTKQPVLSPQI